MPNVEVYAEPAYLVRSAAERVTRLAEAATTTRGRFSIALSGGSTPRSLYELLGSEEFAARIDWPLVHVFWGDERCVSPEYVDSNYHMARRALLDYVPLPIGNIYRMRGEIDPAVAAEDYERKLQAFFSGRASAEGPQPRLDLILLGMGDDGHTASLFPGSAALAEQTRWVTANYVGKLQAWRLTLTVGAINAAANILFMVVGEAKAEALQRVFNPETLGEDAPASLIQPAQGDCRWLVDQAAAARLPPTT